MGVGKFSSISPRLSTLKLRVLDSLTITGVLGMFCRLNFDLNALSFFFLALRLLHGHFLFFLVLGVCGCSAKLSMSSLFSSGGWIDDEGSLVLPGASRSDWEGEMSGLGVERREESGVSFSSMSCSCVGVRVSVKSTLFGTFSGCTLLRVFTWRTLLIMSDGCTLFGESEGCTCTLLFGTGAGSVCGGGVL